MKVARCVLWGRGHSDMALLPDKVKYEELQSRLIKSVLNSDKDDKIKIIPVSQFMNIEPSKMDSVLFG
ncbi:hypothetical protein C6H65_17595 [Photorhabdus luminescens]|nr:hypothetical protein C6H65_17595 [Photorhabdus luminescens]